MVCLFFIPKNLKTMRKIVLTVCCFYFFSNILFAQSLGNFAFNNYRKEIVKAASDNNKLTELESKPTNNSDLGLFKTFGGTLGALASSSGNVKPGLDLGVNVVRYYIPIRARAKLRDKAMKPEERYHGFYIHLLNRAALNLDSINKLASDYLTTLQASPATFRLSYEHSFTEAKSEHQVSFKFTGDGRVIPYGTASQNINFGMSGHAYFTLPILLTVIPVDDSGSEIDKGTFYFEPSFGIAYLTDDLGKSFYKDGSNKIFMSFEVRTGYKSLKTKVNDWGLIVGYNWQEINGAKFRIGITTNIN